MITNRRVHAPPPPRRGDVVETIHGVEVHDPYRWLENAQDPEVRAWMEEEDAHARADLASRPSRDSLRARFTELFYVDWVSPPVRRGGRSFYLRRTGEQEKAVLCWKDQDDAAEQVLVDPNTLSPDGSVSLGTWSPSHDGRYVAYTLRRNAADSATLLVRDVSRGTDLDRARIVDAKYASPSWLPDGSGFYYTWLPFDPSIPRAELPGRAEVRFHVLGTDPESDLVIQPALGDAKAFVNAEVSRDGRWLLLAIQHGWTRTDVWFKDRSVASDARGTGSSPEALGFRPLAVGRDAQFAVVAQTDSFFVLTNDGAPRYRVFRVDPARPEREAWTEIVPESHATLESLQVVGGHLILHSLENASSRLEVRTLDGAKVRRVEIPEIGTTSGMLGNPDEDEAYFSFTSFTQVPQIFRTSVASGATSLWETIRFPADTSPFVANQVFYRSKDGTRVSMFLVHRKDLVRNGAAPTLLTGYGGFAVNMTPAFRSTAVVWVERGGVLAIPNLRGGGEYGNEWHRAGMLARKQSVFDDFIAAAEFLVSERYTRPDKLAATGGSNGGLLVGAAMIQRPDLFGAVVCSVPLLDMVRYHRFGSGMTWTQEYGSADDPEQFASLYAYSPYHRVVPGRDYPALLLLTADSDDRVDPMHARKFAAAMRHASSGTRPVLLRVGRNAGHTGADLVKEAVEQQADQFAFLLDELGER